MSTEECLLPDGYVYKIISFVPKEGNNYTLSCKIKDIRTEDDAKKWLKAYEEKSKFTWRIARTINAAGRTNVYRLDLRCQHKTDARFRKTNKKLTKNTDCPATLKIVIKRYFDVPKLKQIDEETKMFPCIIDLHRWHNHASNSAAVLTFRDMSASTREKLLHLFQTGHTAATARHALQTELLLDNSDNYDRLSADSSILPSLSTIQHLFNETFFDVYGAKKGCNIISDLENLITNYCDTTKGKAALQVIESNVVIAICTPIMQRTIENLPQIHELVLVDASGNMDNLNHRVYFFLSPTVAGGSPIGCIIADAEKEQLFKAGVQLLNTCFPPSFANGPKVFMIDGDLKERKVLSEIWPNAQPLLCQFHILKAAWRWISDAKHSISKEDRPSMYFLIKDLVYSETEDILNEKMKNLQLRIQNEKFIKYLLHLWETRHLWAACYRRGLPIRGNNTNNYIEALFRILKDVIFDRVKAHNLTQLTDFIITKYELYLYQRYLDFSFGKYSKNLLRKFLIDDKNVISKHNIKFDEDTNSYIIESDKGQYFVDINNCFCSCYSGCTGQLCKHIASVVHLENLKLDSKFWYSDSLKSIMYKIATGKEIDKDFLMPLNYNPNAPKQLETHTSPYTDTRTSLDIDTHTPQNTETHPHISQNTETLNTDGVSNEEKENIKIKFEEWYNKVCNGLEHNPEVYFPAVKKMLTNDEKYASTETGLVSALHNFAKYEGPRTQSIRYTKRKGNQIAVQPTAIGRRKVSLSGKRKVSAGRPLVTSKISVSLKDHVYTNFGALPKKKAPHNLTACVEKNVTLGN